MTDPYVTINSTYNSGGLSASRLAVVASVLTTIGEAVATAAAIKAVKEEEISKIEERRRQDEQNRLLKDLQSQIEELKEQIFSFGNQVGDAKTGCSIHIESLNVTLPSVGENQEMSKRTNL